MNIKDFFIDSIQESMESENKLDEIGSIVEDLSFNDNIYNTSYLKEELEELFPSGITNQELLSKIV